MTSSLPTTDGNLRNCSLSPASAWSFSDWSSKHGKLVETSSWMTFDKQDDWQASQKEKYLGESSVGASCVDRITQSPSTPEVRLECADCPHTQGRVLYRAPNPPSYWDVIDDGRTRKTTAFPTVWSGVVICSGLTRAGKRPPKKLVRQPPSGERRGVLYLLSLPLRKANQRLSRH